MEENKVEDVVHSNIFDLKAIYADGIKVEVRDNMAFLIFFQHLPSESNLEGKRASIVLCRIAIQRDLLKKFFDNKDTLLGIPVSEEKPNA